MLKEKVIGQLKADQAFFNRSISILEEKDSAFAPQEGLFTVANQVAHTGETVNWFLDGAFSPGGFEMNFEEHEAKVRANTTLSAARKCFDDAFQRAVEVVSSKTDEELLDPLPEGPILGGMPRMAVFSGITDHTAHHRGALTIYARLLGKVPEMPYGEL